MTSSTSTAPTVPGFWHLGQTTPDRVALIDPAGPELTYGQLAERVNQLSHALRHRGFGRGSVLAVVLPNCFEYYEVLLATQQVGVDVLTLSTALAPSEFAYILNDSAARGLVVDETIADRFAPVAREGGVFEDQILVTGPSGNYEAALRAESTAPVRDRVAGSTMLYTSGTTGRPKGVKRLLARNASPESVYATHAQRMIERFDWRPGHGVFLLCGPLYHRASSTHSVHALMMGHCVVVTAKWAPEMTLALIERFRVTETHMVPTMFHRLLALPQDVRDRYDVSSLVSVVHAAAPCPAEEKKQMLAWWGSVIYEYYAATEGGGTAVTPSEWLARPGTVGRAWPGALLEIRDDKGIAALPPGEVGTIWLALKGQDFEYVKDPEKTAATRRDGMFTVGDLGRMDDEGWLYIADRRADLIISGGVNIYPAEVESALLSHHSVDEVAVLGVPDEDWGESVKAVVVLHGRVEPEIAEESLREHCAATLANYKQPRIYQFVEALPRSEIGKVLKRELR